MPYSITKTLAERKDETVIASYVTGAPVAPAAGKVIIYVDLVAGQLYREVEIDSRVKNLASRMRETNYESPSGVDEFWSIPIGGGTGNMLQAPTSVNVIDGTISIGIDATLTDSSASSVAIDSCIEQMMQFLKENGFS